MHEQWSSRVASLEGVGTLLLFKYDGKLFRRSTRQACKREVFYGDDAVLFAGTRTGAEQALMLYQEVAGAFGLKVNLQKTKLMAVGPGIEDGERAPITMGNDVVECVEDFTYLGSSVTPNAKIDAEVDRRLASASKAFGALRHAIFKDRGLSITTKRHIYQACVLSVLLYGSECWVPLRRHLKRLNSFHHRRIRTIQ